MPFRSTEINANLTKGAADAADVLQLLRLWDEGVESPAEFQARAIEQNLLGKPSRRRMLDLVKQVLARRYMPDGSDRPARHLAALARLEIPREALLHLFYYHAALAEHLLYVVSAELLYDIRQQGLAQVSAAQVTTFIRGLEASGRAPEYSDSVLAKLSQSALTALRDFGMVEGKAKKRITMPRLPHEVVGYLVHILREEGDSAKRIVEHPDWRLFLLRPSEVEDAILEGARHGHYTYSAAGDIRRFDWHHDSLDDYVDSLCQSHVAPAAY